MKRVISHIADFIRETDKLMLILCFFTTLYGCVAVFSSTHYLETYRPVLIQAISMVIGIIAAMFISAFDYETFIKRWYIAAIIGVIPVILTFFIGFAPEGTDDKAWLDLGFTTFQPAELLKVCFTVTFAAHLSYVKKNINKLKYLVPIVLHGAFPVLLIHFQGDDGTALVFAVMVLFMMWSAGVSWKYFLLAFVAAAAASPIIYFFVMNDDQRARIANMFDIEADIKGIGYQQWRGRMALARRFNANGRRTRRAERLYICQHRRRTWIFRLSCRSYSDSCNMYKMHTHSENVQQGQRKTDMHRDFFDDSGANRNKRRNVRFAFARYRRNIAVFQRGRHIAFLFIHGYRACA